MLNLDAFLCPPRPQVQTLIQNGPSWIIFIVGNYLPSSSSYFLVRRQRSSCTVLTSCHPPLRHAPARTCTHLHSRIFSMACALTSLDLQLNKLRTSAACPCASPSFPCHQHVHLHLHPRTLTRTYRCPRTACGAVASAVWCCRTTSCSVRWCRCRCAWCSPTPPSASSSSGALDIVREVWQQWV